jgi:hypothetical protein
MGSDIGIVVAVVVVVALILGILDGIDDDDDDDDDVINVVTLEGTNDTDGDGVLLGTKVSSVLSTTTSNDVSVSWIYRW